MAKNLIPEIAKMLGVEIGEEFKIRYLGAIYDDTAHIDAAGYLCSKALLMKEEDDNRSIGNVNLQLLLTGNAEIIKLPWKPKNGDYFFSFFNSSDTGLLTVEGQEWGGIASELARLKAGWVYRTREEAETALPKVAEELKVEYEI